MRTAEWLSVALLWVAGGCVSSSEPHALGGESHFLAACESSCGDGLDCIQGVCTRSCAAEVDSCTHLASESVCTADSLEPGAVAICDLPCERDDPCKVLSSVHVCAGGFCRTEGRVGDDGLGSGAGEGGTQSDLPFHQRGAVFPCEDPDTYPRDPLTLTQHVIAGDTLHLRVSAVGGCESHDWGVCFNPSFDASDPLQAHLHVLHDSHGDSCEAFVSDVLSLDLTPLADAYAQTTGEPSGTLVARFFDNQPTTTSLYAFGELTCEQREQAASQQVQEMRDQAAVGCSVDADCSWLDARTTCTPSCGAPVATQWGGALEGWLGSVSEEVCRDYEADGCGPVLQPPCPGPVEPVCVNNLCRSGA